MNDTPATVAKPSTSSRLWVPFYLSFVVVVCWACYRTPIAVEFDRWMYDAVVRTNLGESMDHVFAVVKHSTPRIEMSTAVASPEHLGIIEPMFAIKALYVEIITLMVRAGVPIERAISLVSVLAFFGLAWIVALWTKSPLLAGLLVISPASITLGRSGTPDALSTAVVLAGLWAVTSDKLMAGLLLLLLAVWIRTDNILISLTVVLWLLLSARLRFYQAATIALLAVASVFTINHFSGNYGWLVLFRCSFLGCKPPLDNMRAISVREYVTVFMTNLKILAPQAALWLLMGLAAWRISKRSHVLVGLIAVAAVTHFALFPSPEERTLIWAFLGAGVAFVQSLKMNRVPCG